MTQARLRGGSPHEQKPPGESHERSSEQGEADPSATARHMPYYFPTIPATWAPLLPVKRARLSPEATPSLELGDDSPDDEKSEVGPGVPLSEWLAMEEAREQQEEEEEPEEYESPKPRWDLSSSPEPGLSSKIKTEKSGAQIKAEQAAQRARRKQEEEDDDWEDSTGAKKKGRRRRESTSTAPTVEDALAFFSNPSSADPSLPRALQANKNPSAPSSIYEETSAFGKNYTPPSAKPFKCEIDGCTAAYRQMNGLKYHRLHGKCKIPNGETKKSTEDRRFVCHWTECDKSYKNMNGLRYHYVSSFRLSLELCKSSS